MYGRRENLSETYYYKPETVNSFNNNNYIEYERNGHKNRNSSLDEYINKTIPYLRNIITDLQNSDTWKIQLTIAINFISSRDVDACNALQKRRCI